MEGGESVGARRGIRNGEGLSGENTHRHTDRQRQTDKDRQTDRQTEKTEKTDRDRQAQR